MFQTKNKLIMLSVLEKLVLFIYLLLTNFSLFSVQKCNPRWWIYNFFSVPTARIMNQQDLSQGQDSSPDSALPIT